MATLHVRNVPESLYEALRRCAEENGRSIGSQAVALLNESLSTGRRGFPFFGRQPRARSTRLNAFGDEARAAVVDAQALAREYGHTHVGTDTLLLALLGAQLLPAVSEAAVRERIERGPGSPEGALPFGPDAKQALELALRESLQSRSTSIGPDHLLVGIAVADGPGAAIIGQLGITGPALRAKLLQSFATVERISEFRVVELEGSAADWQDQLADAVQGPYALVQIVGTRAIFGLRRP
jgi:hypothetical protein